MKLEIIKRAIMAAKASFVPMAGAFGTEPERTLLQLAGCGSAAKGWGMDATQDEWGWSPAYGDVVKLRLAFERMLNVEEIRGAVELAWLQGDNRNKSMDDELVAAIVHEIKKLAIQGIDLPPDLENSGESIKKTHA